LLLPGSAVQRISMDKNNGLTGAVALIVKIDITGVFLADSNIWHRDSSLRAASIVAPLNTSYLPTAARVRQAMQNYGLPVGVMIAAGGQLVMCHRFCSFGLGLGLVYRPIRVVRRRVDRI
jgi:hypothetical protein